jgi:hypothetical protein
MGVVVVKGVVMCRLYGFLATDATMLECSLLSAQNALFWTHRRGIRDCAVCGVSHSPAADDNYRSVVIASEPLTDETWLEVPEGTVIGVEPGAHTLTRDLLSASVDL